MFSSFSLIAKPTSSKTSLLKWINKPWKTRLTPCPLSAPGPHVTQRIPGMGIWGATVGFSSILEPVSQENKQAGALEYFLFSSRAQAGEDVCGPSPWMM